MKFDNYYFKARLFPTIITLIPFVFLTFSIDYTSLEGLFERIERVELISNISFTLAMLFLLTQLNRFLGKFIFEKRIFKNELEMPTTRFLLFSDDQFTNNYKLKVRDKVKEDFDYFMPTLENEKEDILNAKKQIVEAVGLIRNKVKNGRLLLQHNIEYGFMRNLIGGSVPGSIVAGINVIYFFYESMTFFAYLNIFLFVFYLTLFLLSKNIINTLGNQYAKVLFQEYFENYA